MAQSAEGIKRAGLILQARDDGLGGMKRILLVLALFTGAARAQTPDTAVKSAFSTGEGVNGEVSAIVVQPDGKIVIGGKFASVNGVPRANIARLNPDGTLDRTFADTIEAGVNGQVFALAIQPNGGIVAGGLFTQAGRTEVMNLVRYNADGTVDQEFGGATTGEAGTNGVVLALAVQPDGKIVVGGDFNAIFGQPRQSLARLNADSTLDGPVVQQNTLEGAIRAIAPEGEASIAGGSFVQSGQNARNLMKISEPAE